MPDSININEVNRAKKLLYGRNVPNKIMFNNKEVQFLAKGEELTSEYVDNCTYRWQKGYTKLHPSEVYGNWFNYMNFDTTDYPTTVDKNCYIWSTNYSERRTIEGNITTNNVTNKNIVSLMNGFSLDNNNNEHLALNRNEFYNKFKSMKHENYTYSGMEYAPTTEGVSYPALYQDTRRYTGYSICKEFLNSTEEFSIFFTLNIDGSTGYEQYSSQNNLPIISIPIYDANHALVKTFKIEQVWAHDTNKDSSNSYQYKDFFANIEDEQGTTINPDDYYSQSKLVTNIADTNTLSNLDTINGENLSGYTATSIEDSCVSIPLYPHISITITCDKENLYLYTNGKFCSSCDISNYLQNGNTFFDIDILFSRNITLDNTGEIVTQTYKDSAFAKLYNLHVFSECLDKIWVFSSFGTAEKQLSDLNVWTYEGDEYPYQVIEKHGPVLEYQGGSDTEFELGDAYYILEWYVDTPTPHKVRDENITQAIQWTFDDVTVFKQGGNTIAHARYVIGDFVWTQNYNITVSQARELYGFHINNATIDAYLEDAVGKTPAYMDNASGTFNYGDWENAFFMPKPCMLRYDGTVAYYLDPNDYTKKEDGSASDVTSLAFEGNAMMEWPLIWYKYEQDDTWSSRGYFYVANYKPDDSYKCWCNIDSNGNITEHFYTSIYNCNWQIDGNKRIFRSISGQYMYTSYGFSNTTMAEEVQYATNLNTTANVEWYTDVFCDRQLINYLLCLITKSVDGQSSVGVGVCIPTSYGSDGPFSIRKTGSCDKRGLFYGKTTSYQVKIFGMENWWGCFERRVAGCVFDGTKIYDSDVGSGKVYTKVTYDTTDSSTVTGYLSSSSGISDWSDVGYVQVLGNGPKQSDQLILSMNHRPRGYFINGASKNQDTSYSSYFADAYAYGGGNFYCTYTTDNSNKNKMGPFATIFRPESASVFVSTGLSCKPIANTQQNG